MATEFARSQSTGGDAWCAMLECYQKYTPKPSNIAELKTALLSIWNDLPQKFIDKAIGNPVISKETSIVCCCSWWTF